MSERQPIRQTFRGSIEAISPLHIGSGEKLQKDMDFILVSKQIHILHRQRLFNEIQKLGKTGVVEFNDAVEDGLMADWIKKKGLLDKVRAYTVPSGTNRLPRDISAQLRDGFGRPLVPGSSLKGSMRTAIISHLARADKNRSCLQQAIDLHSKKPLKQSKFDDNKVCRNLLGATPNENLMRGLTVGDVTFKPSDIGLKMVWIDRMISTDKMGPKFPVFVESVQTGARGRGQLSFDLYLSKADLREKCFAFKMHLELSVMLEAIRKITDNTIKHEIDFFEKLSGPHSHEMGAFYRDLLVKQNALADKQILLQLGWGSGWRSMTGPLLSHADLSQNNFALRKNLKLAPKHLKYPFPKSRKAAFDNGHSVSMGWVILTLTPIEEERRKAEKQRQEKMKQEQIRQAEIATEARRQAELDALPEEERQLFLLERGELQEQEVVALYNQLEAMEDQLQLRTAKALKDYWQKVGKWDKKRCSKKQVVKINSVKGILKET
jgi:CRISPR type III-A-associated RAMP protein Csm5